MNSEQRAEERFDYCLTNNNFSFVQHDINYPITNQIEEHIDFVIHLASNTHPVAYATDPIGTITTNIIGVYNMLEFAAKSGVNFPDDGGGCLAVF